MSGDNSSEECEETINQYLQEHGLLEEGMSSVDKRSLWEVIKLSKDTAHAEEQDRQKRARRNLQFDEVSSRSDDGTREEENIAIVVAVSPRPRCSSHDSPQQNTATVNPYRCSPTSTFVSSSSRAVVTPVSPSQQSSSADSPKQIIEPSARRSFRLKPNESFTVLKDNQEKSASPEGKSSIANKQNVPSPRNLKNTSSTRNVENVPSPGLIQNASSSRNVNISSSAACSSSKTPNVPSPVAVENPPPSPEKEDEYQSISQSEEHREATPRKWSEVVTGNSKPTCSPMELPHDESPTSSDHESSPVRRIRQGFNLSLKFSQSEDNNEESCALNGKNEPVPSPVNESTSPVNEKKVVNDRERNIDAFNCDRSNYELTLKMRKPRKMCSRLPFYIPPRKMDVHTYIAYFKKCVSDHAAKLLEVQKRNHKCIPWGDPVVVGETNSKSYSAMDQKNRVTSLQRYNFRERRVASQKVNTIYEDSNSQNDMKTQQEKNDAFFDSLLDDKSSDGVEIIKKDEQTANLKSSAATPERQGSKRKSESSDEMEEKRSTAGTWLSSVDIKDEVAVKRKKLGTVCYGRNWNDVDVKMLGDEGSSNNQRSRQVQQKRGRRKLYNASSKKQVCYAESWEDLGVDIPSDEESTNKQPSQQVQRKRGRRKLNKVPTKKKETVEDDDEGDIFAEITNVEETSSEISTQRDLDIVRPAPVKLRRNGRRRVQQTGSQQQQNEEDVTVVYEITKSDDSNKEQEMEVPCPICRVSYPAKDIEAHASECNEYCAEDIPEDEEQSSSPQAPSQDCWSQYDGVHEGSTQGTAASKHSFGAT